MLDIMDKKQLELLSRNFYVLSIILVIMLTSCSQHQKKKIDCEQQTFNDIKFRNESLKKIIDEFILDAKKYQIKAQDKY